MFSFHTGWYHTGCARDLRASHTLGWLKFGARLFRLVKPKKSCTNLIRKMNTSLISLLISHFPLYFLILHFQFPVYDLISHFLHFTCVYTFIPQLHTAEKMSGKSLADRTATIKTRMTGAQLVAHVRQLQKCDEKCHDLFLAMADARLKIGISGVRCRASAPMSARLCAVALFCCGCCAG